MPSGMREKVIHIIYNEELLFGDTFPPSFGPPKIRESKKGTGNDITMRCGHLRWESGRKYAACDSGGLCVLTFNRKTHLPHANSQNDCPITFEAQECIVTLKNIPTEAVIEEIEL